MESKFQTAKVTIAKRRSASRRSQHGATLVEAVAFLGIAALILLGAVALFSSAFSSARSNSLTEEVTAIQSGIRATYGSGAQLSTNLAAGIAGLVQANALPSTLQVNTADNTVTNTWGGSVTVAWSAGSSSAVITYTGVPKSACIAALTNSGTFTTVSTSTNAVAKTAPLSASDAIAYCGSNSNTINWNFTS